MRDQDPLYYAVKTLWKNRIDPAEKDQSAIAEKYTGGRFTRAG
jgi:hypothetical protein